MSVSRLPPTAFSLKQFLQRQRVLSIYRNMLRTIRQVPDEGDRKYLRDWAREEFKRNKTATNQVNAHHYVYSVLLFTLNSSQWVTQLTLNL
uniref:LYR motif-containing protein 2 n=1 Tax=Myripristis murdjan TaxID=586833 RepID=A0A667Z0A8_9TELE